MPTPSIDVRRPHATAYRRPRGVVPAVLLAAAATVAGAVILGRSLGDGTLVWRAAVLAVGGGTALLWLAARRLTTPSFGAANAVTLVRAVLVLLLVASLGVAPTDSLAWLLVVAATGAIALDGVAPTAENLGSGKYPLWIDYALVYREERLDRTARDFLAFVASEEGRAIIRRTGLAPLGN